MPVSTLTCTFALRPDRTATEATAFASSKELSVMSSPSANARGSSSGKVGLSSRMSASWPISRSRAASATFATAKESTPACNSRVATSGMPCP